MNDYEYEERHLNMKKVIGAILIAILLIIGIVLHILSRIPKKEEVSSNNIPQEASTIQETESSSIFYDTEKKICVELPKSYGFKKFTPSDGYILELRTDNNLDIFISKKEKIENRSLQEVVASDRRVFIATFDGHSNISELKELSVNEKPAYTYSFHYLDSNLNQAFYIQVTWIEYEDGYYVFDVEFPLNDLESYTNVITETLASFKVN